MTQTLLRSLRFLPLPGTMDDALAAFDAVSLDKSSSYHSTCFLPVSYSFYTTMSPWILQNSFLDKLEFDLVIDCPTFQFATEVGISPDFDDALCIRALSLTQRFVKKVSIIRDVSNKEIQNLVINTPSLQRLYVEPTQPSEAPGVLNFIMRVMKEHVTPKGRVAAASAFHLFLKGHHVRAVLDELVKADALPVLRDLLLKFGTKDLDLLETLFEGISAAAMIDRVVKAQERMKPGCPLPPPKEVDFFAEIFELLSDFFKNGDIKFLSARPSLIREIAEFMESFTANPEFLAKYMEDLLIPFMKEIENRVLLNRDEVFIFENKDQVDEYNNEFDPSIVNVHKAKNLTLQQIRGILVSGKHLLQMYTSVLGDEYWCGRRMYISNFFTTSSSSSNMMMFGNASNKTRTTSGENNLTDGENFYGNVKEDEIRRLEEKAARSRFLSSDDDFKEQRTNSSSSNNNHADAAESNNNPFEEPFKDDFDGDGVPVSLQDFRRLMRCTVPSYRKAFFKMIDSGRKTYSHVPFEKILEFYDFINNEAIEITYMERAFMRKSVSEFFQRIFIHYIKRHTAQDERQLMPLMMLNISHTKTPANKNVKPNTTENPELDYLFNRSLLDYEITKLGTPFLLQDNVMRTFINILFKKRTPENCLIEKKKRMLAEKAKKNSSTTNDTSSSEDDDDDDEAVLDERHPEHKARLALKQERDEQAYSPDKNQTGIHTFLFFFTAAITANPVFARNFALSAMTNGLVEFIVQDMQAIQEQGDLHASSKLWSSVVERELKAYVLLLKKIRTCLMLSSSSSSEEQHQTDKKPQDEIIDKEMSAEDIGDDPSILVSIGFMQNSELEREWFKKIFVDKEFDRGETLFTEDSSDDDDEWLDEDSD